MVLPHHSNIIDKDWGTAREGRNYRLGNFVKIDWKFP